MTGGFNQREPTNKSRIHLHPPVVEIFRRHNWLGLFELLRGYDDYVAQEFSMALNPQARISATMVIRGILITITPQVLCRITTLTQGMPW